MKKGKSSVDLAEWETAKNGKTQRNIHRHKTFPITDRSVIHYLSVYVCVCIIYTHQCMSLYVSSYA